MTEHVSRHEGSRLLQELGPVMPDCGPDEFSRTVERYIKESPKLARSTGGNPHPNPFPELPWPLTVIDIEASSLDLAGYPIEVGLARWPAPHEPIFGWSTLIRPTDEWRLHGHWSPVSAKVHGIRGSDLLAHGRSPQQVAAALNEAIGPGAVVWCDGGPYDAQWMQVLFKAGGVKPAFALGDWHRLASRLGGVFRERALVGLERVATRHRARADAEGLLFALADAIGLEDRRTEDLATRVAALARSAP